MVGEGEWSYRNPTEQIKSLEIYSIKLLKGELEAKSRCNCL